MKLFADRVFVIINGFEVVEVEATDYSANKNLTPVDTMTRNKRSLGFRGGNLAIALNLTLAVESAKAQINLALADEAADISVGVEMGGDSFLFTQVVQNEISGTGTVGNATKSLALLAVDFTDENGRSRLSDLNLS